MPGGVEELVAKTQLSEFGVTRHREFAVEASSVPLMEADASHW